MRDLFVTALLASISSTMMVQATAQAADHYERTYTTCQDVDDSSPNSAFNSFSVHMLDDAMSPSELIAQASRVSSANESTMVDRTIGVCFHVSISGGGGAKWATTSPLGEVGFYLKEFENFTGALVGTATIAENPQHGSLAEASALRFRYTPAEGYRGPDKAAFLVDIGNRRIKIVYSIQVTDEEDDSFECETDYWKMSLNGGAVNSVLSSFGYLRVNPSVPVCTIADCAGLRYRHRSTSDQAPRRCV